jgi:hypothetical protein
MEAFARLGFSLFYGLLPLYSVATRINTARSAYSQEINRRVHMWWKNSRLAPPVVVNHFTQKNICFTLAYTPVARY